MPRVFQGANNRKASLQSFEHGDCGHSSLIFAIDIALLASASTLALVSHGYFLKLLGSACMTAGIVRLFMIGHDACHGSLFKSRLLNNIYGRIAFLPSLTAFSLWDVGHNGAHHSFNNLRGRDQVWTPYSKEEFDSLPRYRRALERIYRSGVGWGLYYFLELWWKKLYFATRKQIGSRRIKYSLDSALVTASAASWVATTLLVARETDQSFWLLAIFTIALPFALWNVIMGFVVYVHHTHPTIAWFQNRRDWQRARAHITATANVRLPLGIDRVMHNIMEHNAHHLNPRIPMIALRGAQDALCAQSREPILSYRMSWRAYRDCVRRCKLYDYTHHYWLDWHGKITARVSFGARTQAAAGAVAMLPED